MTNKLESEFVDAQKFLGISEREADEIERGIELRRIVERTKREEIQRRILGGKR